MKLVKPSFEIWNQESGIEGIYKQIERAGRVCYKSEDKIAEGTAKEFVLRMARSGHTAMLEHGSIHLLQDMGKMKSANHAMYNQLKYTIFDGHSRFELSEDEMSRRFTTNMRVIFEKTPMLWDYIIEHDDLPEGLSFCEPMEERVTVHFDLQIAISREFNRHRVNSIAEQSTRYCNFGKDKFGGVNINIPSWVSENMIDLSRFEGWSLPTFDELKEEYFSKDPCEVSAEDWGDIEWWIWSNYVAEESYLKLLELGRKPQEARVVLPLDTNTELVHTAFISDWKHFFELRDDKQHAHPDAYFLAHGLHSEMMPDLYDAANPD